MREIQADGKLWPNLFYSLQSRTGTKKIPRYPFYTKSKDKAFVEACNELLANPLMTQQWVEEADRKDP